MRYLILLLVFCSSCSSKQNVTSTTKPLWEYNSNLSSLQIDGNKCEISITAVPQKHQLKYTISYKGSGDLYPIQLSTIEGRVSAVLIDEKIKIEKDTIIQGSIHPHSNLLKFVEVGEKGPLRNQYQLNYQENGKFQYLTFRLDERQFHLYQKEYPYSSTKKSFYLSSKNLESIDVMTEHLEGIIQNKKKKGAKGIRFSENELNVAGLICHIKTLYEDNSLQLELTWINHTELDLWILKPQNYLLINQEKYEVEWGEWKGKRGFRKGSRIALKTTIHISSLPSSLQIPINNILFFDSQEYFPKDFYLDLEERKGV